jgi:GMP synthase-like glutamine amidotransferase
MRILCIQHEAFEGPGNIARWAEARGHTLQTHTAYDGGVLPQVADFDMLLLMGGSMSANDAGQLPWLRAEIVLIRAAMAAGRHILGICLGAQLIAAALDARVHRQAHAEIGWFTVETVNRAAAEHLGLPPAFTAFHWHGETFDLPSGAVHLARSEACANQAFLYGDRVLAFQFHPEANADSVAALIAECGHEIGCGQFETPPEKLLNTQRLAALDSILFTMLDRFTVGA